MKHKAAPGPGDDGRMIQQCVACRQPITLRLTPAKQPVWYHLPVRP